MVYQEEGRVSVQLDANHHERTCHRMVGEVHLFDQLLRLIEHLFRIFQREKVGDDIISFTIQVPISGSCQRERPGPPPSPVFPELGYGLLIKYGHVDRTGWNDVISFARKVSIKSQVVQADSRRRIGIANCCTVVRCQQLAATIGYRR